MKLLEFLEELINQKILLEKSANLYKRRWDQEKRLWVYDHREKLGLSEKDSVVVHHKNGNHEDNSPENLIALSRAEHAKEERPALKHEKCRICGAPHYAKGLCQKHYKRKWRKALSK